jgi:uncharacterized membrane protein
MKREKRILEEVEKTLQAFDLIPELDANPFLFTRIRAQRDKSEIIKSGKVSHINIVKPLLLFLLIIINILTAIYSLSSVTAKSADNSSLIEILDQNYNIDRIQSY